MPAQGIGKRQITELQSSESDCWAVSLTVVVRGRINEKFQEREKGRASQDHFQEKGGDGDHRIHSRDSNKPWNEHSIKLATTSIQDERTDQQ